MTETEMTSLPNREIIRRLKMRYPEDASTAVEKSSRATPEADTVEVRERKEAIIARAQKATGVSAEDVAITLAVQAAAIPAAGDCKGDPEKRRELVSTAVETLEQIKPEGGLQSMLAAQMIATHNSAIKFLVRADDSNQSREEVDANVMRSARLMRVFNDQLEAFAKLKGKTLEKKVVVKHVHVHEGGQAIVGPVTKIGEVIRGGAELKAGVKMKIEVRPHERRGVLRNGNPPGDLSAVPSCGAKTRRGVSCRCPAMRNGRCRLHGGLSTGPKTQEGRQRIRLGLLKHGQYTKEAMQERLQYRELLRISGEVLHQIAAARS